MTKNEEAIVKNISGKPFTILFRTDANPRIGYGHLNRCLSLAKILADMGGRAVFLFGETTSDVSQSRMDGLRSYVLPQGTSFQNETEYIEDNIPTLPDAIVIDSAHPDTRSDLPGFEKFLFRLASSFYPVALIDAFGVQSLRSHLGFLAAHLVIAPYAGETQEIVRGSYRFLAGPDFFVLPKEFQEVTKRSIQKHACRILVTCGGADPAKVTLKALSALSQISKPVLSVRIIIGPMFPASLVADIQRMTEKIDQRFETHKAPESLFPHMKWCDLAIATSGLTKYELAATGIPTLLLSPDTEHDEINRPFASFGTAKDLGVHDIVSPENLAAEILGLIKDQHKRKLMAEKGQALLDGRGAFRIIKQLRELHDAKQQF